MRKNHIHIDTHTHIRLYYFRRPNYAAAPHCKHFKHLAYWPAKNMELKICVKHTYYTATKTKGVGLITINRSI